MNRGPVAFEQVPRDRARSGPDAAVQWLHTRSLAVGYARIGELGPRRDEMSDTMNDVEEPTEDEEAAEADDDEPTEADLADATVPPDPATGGDVESIQELLVKQEAADEADADDDDDAVVAPTKEEKLAADPADSRVVPQQSTEFVCKRCFLVKHRSQLADKKRTLCRDCA
jgi:hypothetical protein